MRVICVLYFLTCGFLNRRLADSHVFETFEAHYRVMKNICLNTYVDRTVSPPGRAGVTAVNADLSAQVADLKTKVQAAEARADLLRKAIMNLQEYAQRV